MKQNGTPAKANSEKKLKGVKAAKATPIKAGKAKKDELAEMAAAIVAEELATPVKGAGKAAKATPAKVAKATPAKVAKATPAKAAKATPAKATPAKAAKATPAKAGKGKVPPKKAVQAADSDDEDDDDDSEEQIDNEEELKAVAAESEEEEEDDDDDDDDEEESDEEEEGNGLIENEAEDSDEEENEEAADEDDDDEEDDDEDDDDNNVNVKNAKAKSKVVAQNDSDDEDEDDEDDDDDAPTAAKIKKTETEPESELKPKINFKIIDNSIPMENVIEIHGIKKDRKITPVIISRHFYKYGDIKAIVFCSGLKAPTVQVAFDTAEAAKAALVGNKSFKLLGSILEAKPKTKVTPEQLSKFPANSIKQRTVVVENIPEGTMLKDLHALFKDCGPIFKAELNSGDATANVVFEFPHGVTQALKHNDTVFKGVNITVKSNARLPQHSNVAKTNALTITLINKESGEVQEAQVREIFEKCGAIAGIEVLNKNMVLAFVTFANEEAATEAMELNGTTVGGLTLALERFKSFKDKSTIVVENVATVVPDDDIRNHFKNVGEIVELKRLPGKAIIKFSNSEAFCKSFLLDESYLCGAIIFIVPYSVKKMKMLHSAKKANPYLGYKAPYSGPGNKRPFNAPGNKRPYNAPANGNAAPFYAKGGAAPNKRFKKTPN